MILGKTSQFQNSLSSLHLTLLHDVLWLMRVWFRRCTKTDSLPADQRAPSEGTLARKSDSLTLLPMMQCNLQHPFTGDTTQWRSIMFFCSDGTSMSWSQTKDSGLQSQRFWNNSIFSVGKSNGCSLADHRPIARLQPVCMYLSKTSLLAAWNHRSRQRDIGRTADWYSARGVQFHGHLELGSPFQK